MQQEEESARAELPGEADGLAHEPLPEQEEFYRAPARFGNIPVEAEPKGWDRRRRFEKHYPRLHLPMQILERVSLGHTEPHEPNRLIWGDNLHIMRQLPSNSVDLIYIDPPFFSGRQYNTIWGDNNEVRSFNDIWEGGLDGYLVWLNARLYEMKRLLKVTGSIYVHCDWHASHYIKVEMDKIFGYAQFLNEIVWGYGLGGSSKKYWSKKHDVILFYSKTDSYYFDKPMMPATSIRMKGKKKGMLDFWVDIPSLNNQANERIGYPTQKPKALLERIIKASSNEGDIVADFFVGGGTTPLVAQRLGRRWLAADQSRVAIAVTAERLKQPVTLGLEDAPYRDFTVEHWGVYEAERLSAMPAGQFRDFVLRAYGATRINDGAGNGDDSAIHGWRNQLPIWVGEAGLDAQATAADVRAFANAIRGTTQYQQANLRDGIMLAWGFRADASAAAVQLRQQEAVDVNFVRLKQIRIGDDDFREHIVRRSTDWADYGEFLTFVQPPVVSVGWRALGGLSATFDAGDTAVVNPGAELINLQWDFNYNGRHFTATPGYSFQRGKSKKRGKEGKLPLRVTHKFSRPGAHRVACRAQDSRGGEGMWAGEVRVR